MGGLDPAVVKATDEEITQRLKDIGRKAGMPAVHTVWVVEDPPSNGNFPYKDRSDVDNICHVMPVSHFELFPFGVAHLHARHIAFYPYKYEAEAIADAVSRLARVGRRCAFCHGSVHPASGCQYTETFIVCGTCIRPYQDVMNKLPKAGLPAYLESWTSAKGFKKLKDRFPGALGFYESAGKFLGQDNRKVGHGRVSSGS